MSKPRGLFRWALKSDLQAYRLIATEAIRFRRALGTPGQFLERGQSEFLPGRLQSISLWPIVDTAHARAWKAYKRTVSTEEYAQTRELNIILWEKRWDRKKAAARENRELRAQVHALTRELGEAQDQIRELSLTPEQREKRDAARAEAAAAREAVAKTQRAQEELWATLREQRDHAAHLDKVAAELDYPEPTPKET